MDELVFILSRDPIPTGPDISELGFSLQETRAAVVETLEHLGKIHYLGSLPDSYTGEAQCIAFNIEQALRLSEVAGTSLLIPLLDPALVAEYERLLSIPTPHPVSLLCRDRGTEKQLLGFAAADRVRCTPFLNWSKIHQRYPDIQRHSSLSGVDMEFNCALLDSNEFNVSTGLFRLEGFGNIYPEHGPALLPWDGNDIELGYKSSDFCGMFLNGFFPPEPWGSWSCSEEPSVNLPYAVSGDFMLIIELQGYGENIDRQISVWLGPEKSFITPGKELQKFPIRFSLAHPQSRLFFGDLDLSLPSDATDMRTLGIGLRSIKITAADLSGADTMQATLAPLNGLVYSACLPTADRVNNYSDLITGFCTAFRDEPRANLILNIDYAAAVTDLMEVLLETKRCMPFECRVILLAGHLDLDDQRRLLELSTYYINPAQFCAQVDTHLLFLACGLPTISANHAVLEGYLQAGNSFLVESSYEPIQLLQEDGSHLQGMSHRLNWDDFTRQLRESFRLAQSREELVQMRSSARTTVEQFAGNELTIENLRALQALECAGQP